MTIQIEERRDYELYLTKEIERLYPKLIEANKTHIRAMLMGSFDDGIAFNQKNLKVDTYA